jgi:hypothetical protein
MAPPVKAAIIPIAIPPFPIANPTNFFAILWNKALLIVSSGVILLKLIVNFV